MKRLLFVLVIFISVLTFSQGQTNGLIGYYPFNGNTNDESGNGFNGVATDIVYVAGHNGVAGQAASFNGSSSKIMTTLSLRKLTGYTVSAWVKVPSDGGGIITDHKGVSGMGDGFSLGNNKFGLDGDYAMRMIEKKDPIPADTWYHITGVWEAPSGSTIDQSQMKLYINGELVQQINILSAINSRAVPFNADTAMVIGRHFGWNQWFKGAVDELRIYNRALTNAEINLLYKGIAFKPVLPDNYLVSGNSYTISWLKDANISSVNIAYSINNGNTWTSIANGVSGNSYSWTVPAITADSLKIRIRNAANISQSDESQYFEVVNNPLNYGLLAYYPLNGNTSDVSGNGNHAQGFNLSDTTDISGFEQRAMYFDSDADTLEVKSAGQPFRTGSEGTISLWVRKNNWATSQTELLCNNRRDAGISQFQLNLHQSVGLHFRYGTWNTGNDKICTYTPSRSWAADSWHHVAIRWKREAGYTTISLFADGNLVSKDITTLLIDDPANWNFSGTNDGHASLKGCLDEIRIYNKAVSDDLIKDIYTNGLPLAIISPAEGSDMVKNTQQQLIWSAPYGINQLNIDFSSNNGRNWSSIASSVNPNLGSILWDVPNQLSDSCLFRLSTPAYPGKYFTQNRLFRILADSSNLNVMCYYKLDGNSRDTSGRNYHGTLVGATPAKGLGNISGTAYYFNGSSDYIEMPLAATSGLNKFTFSCWIKTSEIRTNNIYWTMPHIFGNETGSSSDSDFGITTSNGYLAMWTGMAASVDNAIVSSKFISDNNWHHIACTYNGKKVTLFVDGKDIDCSFDAIKPLNNHNFCLMAQKTNSNAIAYYHQGTLDEVKLYSFALDTAEIRQLYSRYVPFQCLTPFENEDLVKNSQVKISWETKANISSVTLHYSLDKGQNWTSIATDVPAATGFYNWLAPATIKDSILIRLAGKENPPSSAIQTVTRFVNIVNDITDVNLVAWYPFDNDGSDLSGNNHHATVNGATLVNAGIGDAGNKAYSFDGISNDIYVQNLEPLQQFSISAWYKTSYLRGTIASLWGAGYISINNYEDNAPGQAYAAIENSYANYSLFKDTAITSDDTWHHMVLTVNTEEIKFYVDKRLIKTEPVVGRIDFNFSTWYLGVYENGTTMRYKGLIDDVRFYKGSISKSVIDAIYAKTIPNAIKERYSDIDIIAYPNPSNGIIYIKASAGTTVRSVEVYNIHGTKVLLKTGNITDGIDLTSLNKGLYFIKVTTNKGITAFKQIVQ